MDPSGAGLCLHTHDNVDESAANHHRAAAEEVLKPPTPNGGATNSEGPHCGLQPSKADFREEKANESRGKVKDSWGWRRIVRDFTPS